MAGDFADFYSESSQFSFENGMGKVFDTTKHAFNIENKCVRNDANRYRKRHNFAPGFMFCLFSGSDVLVQLIEAKYVSKYS